MKDRQHRNLPAAGTTPGRAVPPGTRPEQGTDEENGRMDLAVISREEGGATVVAIEGEIDIYTAAALRTALDRLIDDGSARLVVDLARLAFIDSIGLGVLVGRLKRVRLRGGWIRIVCVQERILRPFRITGLEKVFPLHNSVESALKD